MPPTAKEEPARPDAPAQKKAGEGEGLPVAHFDSLNSLLLEVIKKMPQGGGYAVTGQAAANLVSSTALDPGTGALKIDARKAQPSFCSGATYLAFLEVISELQTKYRLELPAEVTKALLVQRQADGVGVWGRWNANGPGTAKLFHDLGLGINFTDFAQARPGDFMKIWWNDGIGSTERGHSVIYLGSSRGGDGTEMVKFWSSNQDAGFSEKSIPREKIVRVLFSRLEDPSQLARVPTLPAKDDYLAAMLKRPSTEEEMFQVCGVEDPPGSSLLRPGTFGNGAGVSAAGSEEPSPLLPPSSAPTPTPPAPLAPGLNELFAGTTYLHYNFFSKTKILRLAQEVMAAAKDYPGEPDGAPGPMTDGAIKAWQKKQNLTPSGLLDVATLKSMDLDGLKEEKEPAPSVGPPRAVPSPAPTEPKALPKPSGVAP